jgi:cyclophilin family peptidyl-prolyl cis-trans isomerase
MNAIAVCLLVLVSAAGAPPAPGGELEPISATFRKLYESLRAKGGVAARDHEVIRSLRERVAAFNRDHRDDPRGLALELQLSQWLDDRERVDELFARLLNVTDDVEIGLAWAAYYERLEDTERVDSIYERLADRFPGAPVVVIGRARSLVAVNDYGAALELLERADLDPAEYFKAALLRSTCLFAEHRYQEAVEAMEAIPQEVVDMEGTVRFQVTTVLPQRREYVGLWDQEQQIRSAEAAADDLPRAEIVTSRGGIVVELFENEAPNTVANFISLAESGFYDGTTFHRVEANFMAQGGDPNSKPGATGEPGTGGPGYRIPDEHDREGARMHFTGSLAMAKTSEPHSGGCQFYLTHTAPAHLNGKHTVFGRVLEGLDVARRLEVGDVIERVTVLRKRDHEYKPQTLPETDEAPADEDPADEAPADEVPEP